MQTLIVFVGAGVGGAARFALGSLVQQAADSSFPWGTLAVNLTGSLLLGFLYSFLDATAAASEWRLLLGVGLCGGYTTFSTLTYESVRLIQESEFALAGAYMAASVLLGLLATLVGFRAAAALIGRA
jgi:CrcB protein